MSTTTQQGFQNIQIFKQPLHEELRNI